MMAHWNESGGCNWSNCAGKAMKQDPGRGGTEAGDENEDIAWYPIDKDFGMLKRNVCVCNMCAMLES